MTKTTLRPTIQIRCPDCPKTFRSSGYMEAHLRKHHRPLPMRHQPTVLPRPFQPDSITKVMPFELPETLTLLNGDMLEPGDVFYQVRRFVVRKIYGKQTKLSRQTRSTPVIG